MFMLSDHQMLQCDPMVPILPLERNWKPNVEIAPNCPRCASPNTKFCYYNNYSLSQPRYICKGCKRYWTKGGSLRNVPVGGGCRKSRRRSKSSRETRGDHHQIMKDYSKNSSSGVSSSSDGDSKNQQPDIDLAVVFAKFLNHNNASFDDHHQPNEDDHNNSQKQAVHHSNPESYDMLQELPETEAFELQNLLAGDDHHQMVLQDELWADHDAAESKTPDFEWQPMVQLQHEFESFPGEEYDHDQLKVSASLMNGEDWGSFDLSGFGIFSKPST